MTTATTSFPPSWPITFAGMPRGSRHSLRITTSLRRAVVGREQPVPQQIAHGARPGFVRVAAKICAHGPDELPGMRVPQIDIHVEDEGRDLLNLAGDGEIGAKPLCQLHVTAATGLQITGVCC